MRKNLRMMLLGLLAVFLPFVVQAQNTSLSGQITEANTGLPIAGASVEVLPVDSTIFTSFQATSDSSGFYSITGMSEADYLVIVSAANYRTEVIGPVRIVGQASISVALYSNQATGNGRISGQITDQNTGLPISGADVLAFGDPIRDYQTTTDSTGFYEFDSLSFGVYKIFASALGYEGNGNNNPVFLEPNAPEATVDLALRPDPNIGADIEVFGQVSDSTGNAVFRAGLFFTGIDSSGDSIAYVTWTGIDGSYRTLVRAGTYDVVASAQGYDDTLLENIAIEQSPFELNVVMNRSGSGNGFAFLNGTLSDSTTGQPVEFAVLSLFGNTPAGDSLLFKTISFPDGSFDFFEPIPVGTYQLSVEAPNYLLFTTRVNLVDGQNSLPIFLEPISGSNTANVQGIVVDSLFNQPISNALLTFTGLDSSNASYRTQSRQDGSFGISIPAGRYEVSTEARDYQSKTSLESFSEGFNRLQISLMPLNPPAFGTISGQVTIDGSGDPAGPNSAFIEIMAQDGSAHYSATVDSGGNYRASVVTGDYYVAVYYFDANNPIGFPYLEYYDDVFDISNATVVTVTENSNTSGIDFGVPEGGAGYEFSVSGNVSDDSGNPLSRARVIIRGSTNQLFGDSLYFETFTDQQGNYDIFVPFFGIPFNSLVVSADQVNYDIEFWQEQPSITLADELLLESDTSFTNINFTLTPQSGSNNNSISGTVLGDDNLPIAQAFVVGSNMNTGRITFAFTDALGQYALGGLESDPFVILFAAASHLPEYYDDAAIWEDAQMIQVNGNITGVDAQLSGVSAAPGNGIVTGTIADITGNNLSGVLVSVIDDAGNLVGYDFSTAQGTYQIPGVPEGEHTIRVTKVNYVSEIQSLNYADGGAPIQMHDFSLENAVLSVDPDEASVLPTTLKLDQNYPNPFNPSTNIRFALPQNSDVKLTVYNALGQRVIELVNGQYSAGEHQITWNGIDQNGRRVSSGIYLYRLEAAGKMQVRKMLFTK